MVVQLVQSGHIQFQTTRSHDLTYADGHHEWIPFLDILGLLPRSWQRYDANYIVNELFHQVHPAALESQEVRNNPTRPKNPLYTEGHSNIFKVWDSPDGIPWKEATDKEYFILEDKRKCWIKIKIKDIPRGKSLIDVRNNSQWLLGFT